MNFFALPKDKMTRSELDELVRLYRVARLHDGAGDDVIAASVLADFHHRQPSVGISDRRLAQLLRLSLLSAGWCEKNAVLLMTRCLPSST